MNYRGFIVGLMVQIFAINSVLIGQDLNKVIDYNSYKFNDFVNTQIDTSKSLNLKNELSDLLLARLEKDKRTNFENIINIVDLHVKIQIERDAYLDLKSIYFFKTILGYSKNDKYLYGILKNRYIKYWIDRSYTFSLSLDKKDEYDLKFEELLASNVDYLDQKRTEYIYDYLKQSYEMGIFHLSGNHDFDFVESFFINVISYPFQYEPNKELREKLYELYYLANIELLRIRKKKLNRLERTFFVGPKKEILEQQRDYYINKLKNK